jgi:hypothetical protein
MNDGKRILATLSQKLAVECGKGFKLRRQIEKFDRFLYNFQRKHTQFESLKSILR